ncbi:MAG: class I SAM-dependent methyltransferase [Bdellovibrionales bacterium]|nr:class I SAM-dependent methyltransferase [Bdellovibrionales bacterium]
MLFSHKNPLKRKIGFLSDGKKIGKFFFQYLRHRGMYASFVFFLNACREWLWFASHRKTAANLISVNLIEKNLESRKYATYYIPTPIIPFFKMIKSLTLPPSSVFVDYGAGKGRAMILAAESGAFSKIKGLEFSPSLFKIAQKNIQSYENKTGQGYFELIHADVLTYKVQKEDNFFYFFHPFNDDMLCSCLDNIYLSLKEYPRKVLLVYQINSRENTSHITKNGVFKLGKTFFSYGARFYVYEHSPN